MFILSYPFNVYIMFWNIFSVIGKQTFYIYLSRILFITLFEYVCCFFFVFFFHSLWWNGWFFVIFSFRQLFFSPPIWWPILIINIPGFSFGHKTENCKMLVMLYIWRYRDVLKTLHVFNVKIDNKALFFNKKDVF